MSSNCKLSNENHKKKLIVDEFVWMITSGMLTEKVLCYITNSLEECGDMLLKLVQQEFLFAHQTQMFTTSD